MITQTNKQEESGKFVEHTWEDKMSMFVCNEMENKIEHNNNRKLKRRKENIFVYI